MVGDIKEGRKDLRGCVVINDIDVTDYTRNFSNEEMPRMGHKGHDHTFHRRNGNGGYGRGEVNPPQANDCRANRAVVIDSTFEEHQMMPYQGGALITQQERQKEENTSTAHRAAQGHKDLKVYVLDAECMVVKVVAKRD